METSSHSPMHGVNNNETAAFVGSFLSITLKAYYGIDLDHVMQCVLYAALGGFISIGMREGLDYIKQIFKKK